MEVSIQNDNQISRHTTSVIYDRAGTGWSDEVKLPRSAREVTDELRSLLHHAGIPAPYLFVGHSLGGIYARLYAQRFPDEAAGMLLLEPAHEDFLTHTPKIKKRYMLQTGFVILRTLLTYKQVFRGLFDQMFAKWPDSIRGMLIEYHLRTISDIPIIVYTAMGIDPFTTPIVSKSVLRDTNDSFNDAKKSIYEKLANSVPRGQHRTLNHAGHTTMHTDCPDEITEAILNILDLSKKA